MAVGLAAGSLQGADMDSHRSAACQRQRAGRTYSERQATASRPAHFDARRAPRARLADISLRRFEEDYLPAAVDAETLAGNDRSTEERLAAAKMIVSVDDPVPTVGGVLVLGKRPQDFLPGAYAQFLRVAGTEFGDSVTDSEVCRGQSRTSCAD